MPSKSQAGYPNRRAGSCLSNESGHHTWDKWWTCCPPGTTYEDYDGTTRCQLSTTTGEVPEQCANSSSTLWWKDNYFCCDPQLVGFANEHGSFGCSTQSDVYNGYSNGTMTNANQRPQTASPTSSATSSSASSESSGSSTSKGAIAGGVVGGVCGVLIIIGIIWFLLRRRRLSSASRDPSKPALPPGLKYGHEAAELGESDNIRSELYGSPVGRELPTDIQSRQELPGSATKQSPSEPS
ncbi:hypothetical protein BDV33DRAFT_200386 [Aspergillus novoparasiticus]|uniref:Uncharacterized protein n=1 Tax=Aspergillus novoparasiticus TaxID=986946 RepID=A0A5N6F3B7_9EURO|nr:hypothetical protein BDV33DRAFT_200386 [Aspergillus novoparasiticus]